MKKSMHNHIEAFMDFIIHHSSLVLAMIAIITVFFAFSLTKLGIDTNVYAFIASAPSPEEAVTPDDKPDYDLILKGINQTPIKPEKGEIPEIPIRKNSFTEEEFENSVPYSPVEPIINEYEGDKSTGSFPDGYVIIFSSDRMFEPEVLNTIYQVRSNLEKRYEIGQCLSPFDYVTVQKKGTRLSIVPISPVKAGEEWDEESAAVFKQRLMNDSIAKNYLYSEDGSTMMIYYRARNLNAQAIAELDTIINPLRQYGKVALNGGGLINNAVMKYLNKDLITLLVLCFIVILAIYYLSFRSVKAMLIPASLSLIGIIWTLGIMALAGYKLTIVTILTPCLVLTLGSSYSIHMISEYFEANAKGEEKQMARHYAKILTTIFFAMITTIAGFLSLLVCRTPIFKEFGITIAIGVFICGFLAFTYLPAVLSKTKRPKQKQIRTVQSGMMTRIVGRTASVVTEKWWVFIIILVLIIASFLLVKDDIGFDSNYMSYFPKNDQIVKDSVYFAKTLGGTDPYYITITAPDNEKGYFLRSENLKYIYSYEQTIQAACPDIVQILSFSQYVSFLNEVYNGETGIPENNGLINLLSRTLKQIEGQIGSDVLDILINDDASQITLSMRNYDSVEQDLQTTSSAKRLEATLDYYRYLLPEGTTSIIHCLASSGVRASDMIIHDQNLATLISLLLIFIIGSLAFLSPAYGITALIPVSIGVMINYIFMWIAGIPFDIVTVGFSSVAIGAGVDDAIHFIIRYRMKRKENSSLTVSQALKANIIDTGRPIILTTVSVDAGLLMLLFGSYTPIRYFGILMTVALTAAMISTLCMLPPCLILFDKIGKAIRGKLIADNRS